MRFLVLFALMFLAFPACAQEAPDMAERMALARKMHEIKPAKEQIESVVNDIAEQLPESARPAFRERMMAEFDFKKLDEISTGAMAEVFTAAELQRMVDYFGSKESESIEEKMPVFQQLLQPEITRMVDRAMMTVRTGAPGLEPAPAETPVEE